MVSEAFGRPTVVGAHPKHAVALGAALLAEARRRKADGRDPRGRRLAARAAGSPSVARDRHPRRRPRVAVLAHDGGSRRRPDLSGAPAGACSGRRPAAAVAPAGSMTAAAVPASTGGAAPSRSLEAVHGRPSGAPRRRAGATGPAAARRPDDGSTPPPPPPERDGRQDVVAPAGSSRGPGARGGPGRRARATSPCAPPRRSHGDPALRHALGVGAIGAGTPRPRAPEGPTAAAPPPATAVPIPPIGLTIPVGQTPNFVAVAPNGNQLYVANHSRRRRHGRRHRRQQGHGTITIPQGPPAVHRLQP